MEELKNNKIYKFLFWFFIFVSIIYICYATITMRGLYEDGAFYCLRVLNYIANNEFVLALDASHPRHAVIFLLEAPMYFVGSVLGILDKFTLMKVYSCTQFLLPFLVLLWNFNLTKRTGRLDVLFWSIFTYGGLLLLFSIFSVTESFLGATFHFILWNYLVAEIDYKKRDIIAILFLLVIMFLTYEYVILLGVIFFIAHFHYVVNTSTSFKNQCVKTLIGVGSLSAAIYNFIFMFKAQGGEEGEIMRFLEEAYNFFPYILNLNSIFTLAALILLVMACFYKNKISPIVVSSIVVVNILLLIKLLTHQQLSVHPMWEQHMRTIICWALPLMFFGMYVRDFISPKLNIVKFTNFIIIALICCIFHTIWQNVNTFYWDKNIQYLKNELKQEASLLYVPIEHEKISSFFHSNLRRYIWHGTYPSTSILFSEDYELKTLLMLYDVPADEGNIIDRKALYVDVENQKFSAPFGVYIDIKNEFWDLTNVSRALDAYNKENNIDTYK